MEAVGAAARQLYGTTIVVVWNHSPFTYASDYLAMVAGLIAAMFTAAQWNGIKGEKFGLCYQTILACVLQAVGWGMAGIAMHIVDTEVEKEHYVDSNVGGENSDWIFPWFFAMVCKPLCSACVLGASAAYLGTTEARFTAVKTVNAVGCVVAAYEAYLIFSNQIRITPGPEFYWGLFATGVACGSILVVGCGKVVKCEYGHVMERKTRSPSEHWCARCERTELDYWCEECGYDYCADCADALAQRVGMWRILAGLTVRFAGYLYFIFGPETAPEAAPYYSGDAAAYYGGRRLMAPEPDDATKNLVFNVCVAISVIPFCFGAVMKSKKDHSYRELLKQEAADKAAKDKPKPGRACCTGNWGSS